MKLIPFFFIIVLYSCNENAEVKIKDSDSLNGMTVSEWKEKWMDSVKKETNNSISKSIMDTTGLSTGPIQVTNARLTKEEYSNYKSVSLTYKNVSSKKVAAIRFK